MQIDGRFWVTCLLALGLAAAPLPVRAEAPEGGAIRVEHNPVTFAVRGQPLTLKAKVLGSEDNVESVTLYYALFKDAAPFRVPMRSSGLGLYVGTIESGLLTGVETVSYYIEAMDKNGALSETPWQTVAFKDPGRKATIPADEAVPPPVLAPPAPPIAPPGEKSSATTVGIIAGGAAAVVAAALLLSGDDGGDDGGSGGSDTNTAAKAGNYSGSSSTCFTLQGGPTSCSNRPCTIVIDAQGRVFSDSLDPNQSLTGNLSGNDFTLVAEIDDGAGTTGERVYSGTVVNNNRIVGSVSGNVTTPVGPGSFNGSFSAAK
jgi:hypothetical protein